MTIAFKILRPVALFTLSVLTLTPKAHAAGVVGTCDESSLNAAVAGGGIVTFTCSGTISLSKNILIQLPTTIDATGQNVTLNGTDSGDILFIQDLTAVGFNVDLVNLTFLKSALSAVYLTSNIVLHVDNCIFSGNDSGSRHYGGAI